MTQKNRLSAGGVVDRSRPIAFHFNRRRLIGYAGDTLASALLANDVHLVGRSFKYHRPRGIFSIGSEEPNALVQLHDGACTEPNIRATQAELFDGLSASSQNCWPSVNFDLGAVNSLAARLFPAGFYYKTFMWPASWWMRYERLIRRAAGLGKSPRERDPDRYEHMHVHCDVLVVGGGPAGLAAALAVGRSGARVIVADEQMQFGGALLGNDETIDDAPASRWIARVVSELGECPEVTLLPRTTVSGYHDYNFLTAVERVTDHLSPGSRGASPRQRFWKIRARRVVLATGAIERPLVFADNDRPGVMLASAVRGYVNRYGVLPGKRIAVFANNDDAYRTALDAHRAGAVVSVVDIRREVRGALPERARGLGITVHENSAIIGVHGAKRMRGVWVRALERDGSGVTGSVHTIPCSVVAVSGGWTPAVHLFSQSRGQLDYDENLAAFLPGQGHCTNPSRSVGACAGAYALADCLTQGFEAGAAAAGDVGHTTSAEVTRPMVRDVGEGPTRRLNVIPCDHPLGRGPAKHFHDFQNDVTAADIHLAAREGYLSVEHLKRYTTTGMGTDQGKTSNMNALAILSEIRSADIPDVGTTTFRAPYTPVTFGAVAGRNVGEMFDPERKTPMHPWHQQSGAVFEDVGDWKRPWYYPRRGESMHQAVQRECLAVRERVGVLDASTLGKIDIQGPDAAEFLNRIYTNAWHTLRVGRCRYGLMLNEQGMVFDDGVTTRLSDNHFHMTTTTGGAARVLGWLEEWLQTEWPELRAYCTSVTEQWAVAAVSGPRARALLQEVTDIDMDSAAFPFMSMREGHVAGAPARVFRISFSGELGFEINVPARYGLHMWETLVEHGAKHRLCPYGTEAMHVLRAEKGFIIVGQDSDGTVTPMDLGMDWLVDGEKSDFLGKRSFRRLDTSRPGRKQLVGLLTEDPNVLLPEGAHIVQSPLALPPMKMLGHVTSSYMSPNAGRSIALALLADGFNRKGQVLQVRMLDGVETTVVVSDPVFVDKAGARARG